MKNNYNNRMIAQVETLDECNGLYIRLLETDEEAYIPADEISRHPGTNPHRLIGQLIHVAALEDTHEGLPIYSAKVVQDEEYENIRSAFEQGKRNTYTGVFKGMDKTGKLALYEIAEGVWGAIHIKNFGLARLPDFMNVKLPETLPVNILAMGEGKVNLSSVPTFGSFAENVRSLGLVKGSIVEGIAIDPLPNNRGISVILSPNCYSVLPWCPEGKTVSLRITDIDYEHNRVKAVYAKEAREGALLDVRPFIRPLEADWIDVQAFVEANKFKRIERPMADETSSETADAESADRKNSDPSFDLSAASDSPLRIFEGETIVIDRSISHRPLEEGLTRGLLTAKHRELAEAVDELKYCTAFLLEHYLHLTGRSWGSKMALRKALDLLCRYHVLTRFRFSTGEKSSIYYVYSRGVNYRKFAGFFRSYMAHPPVDGDSSSNIKGRLACVQLLIGILHSCTNVTNHGPYRFPTSEEAPGKLTSSYRVETAEYGTCVLESCRRDYDEEMAQKLIKYSNRFRAIDDHPSVLITLEDAEHMEAFAQRIKGLELSCRVMLTHDTKCFEQNPFIHVIEPKEQQSEAEAPRSLFGKLKGMTGLMGSMFN